MIDRLRACALSVACSILVAGCAASGRSAPGATAGAAGLTPLVPLVDHHQHLFSPEKARTVFEPALPAIAVPEPFARLLRERASAWDDTTRLKPLYTADVLLLNTLDEDFTTWMRGRSLVANEVRRYFDEPYRITPVVFTRDGAAAEIAGYYTRGVGDSARHFGHALLSLRRGGDSRWRIATEAPVFPGPPTREPSTADELVAQLDDAGIRRAVVLSVAYQWGSPFGSPVPDEYAKVRAENDYVADQVARHPDRLVAFFSFNPLKDYALTELERCAASGRFRGLKLHLGNSRVDIRKPDHLAKVREVFRAANARRLPIVVHMWNGPAYEREGDEYARVFLDQLLPAAPDVVVQVAHMAGGGRATDPALAVFAAAIEAKDPRTRNLYFDVATLTEGETAENLRRDARRMRQIGFERILYGTDTSPPHPAARISWGNFRALVPLSEAEFHTIASNVAPYLR